MESNKELSQAWDIIENTGANLFLTGKAGTGKTTFLKELKRLSPKRMVVLAPTGIAAINAGGVTVHSFFQLPLSPYLPGTTFESKEQKRYQFGRVKRNIIRTMDLLVIDEISMVRADLLDAVDSVMRRYREPRKPFGGAQLLMIGDMQQLSPVIKEDEWAMLKTAYDTPYFFSSKALAMSSYQTIELKKVYRQQDATFLELLNRIRENHATDETLETLNRRYIPGFRPPKGSDYIRLTTHNRPAQMINEQELQSLSSQPYTFKAQVEGTFPESSYPADENLVLKRGAQIMFIKNDPNHRYFNGMIGEVVDIASGEISVKGKDNGETFVIERAEWTNSKYTLNEVSKEIEETVEGTFRQYPLRLAWAITIHKSQGLTFSHAIIDVSRSFAHGQTYVALSRCKTLEGMVLSAPLHRSAIISDNTLDSFTNSISANQPTDSTMSSLKRTFIIQTLDELFGITTLRQAFDLLLRTVMEHLSRRYPKLQLEYRSRMPLFTELADVAAKFGAQYSHLLAGDIKADNPTLQERIHKGAEYFYKKLVVLRDLLRMSKVTIDNKSVKKQFDERFAVMTEELNVKLRLLDYERQPATIFSTSDYMKAKAHAILGEEIKTGTGKSRKTSQTRTASKSSAPKEEKTPSRMITYEMFSKGMPPADIATKRDLALSTITSHLVECVKDGLIDFHQLVSAEHEAEIRDFIGKHPDYSTLTVIKDNIDPEITYNEIRIIAEAIKAGS